MAVLFGILVLLTAGGISAEEFPVVVEAESRAVVSAEREGVLTELSVSAGDRVQKGQSLGSVFHKDLTLQLEQAQARRKYLGILVENLTKLNEKNLVTLEELAKAEMEMAVNEVEIKMLNNLIERSRIRSPYSARVVTRRVQPHEWVQPGQPVVELYDPAALKIAGDIPSEIAMRMKPGQRQTIYFSDLDRQVTVAVDVFAPQVDVRSNTIKTYWKIPGRGSADLLPGMKGVLKLGDD